MPQNALFWEFKHPHFRKGDIAALSEIKKAIMTEESTPAVNQSSDTTTDSVSDLKTHMSTLDERVSNIDTMIEELAISLRELQSRYEVSGPCNDSYLFSPTRKRKPHLDLNHQWTIDHTNHQQLLQQPPPPTSTTTLPPSSDETSILDDFWNYAESLSIEHSLSDSMTRDSPSSLAVQYYDTSDNLADITGDDINWKTSVGTAVDSHQIGSNSYAAVNSSLLLSATANTNDHMSTSIDEALQKGDQLAETLGVSDIPDILRLLPESLQGRFVDRLADGISSRANASILQSTAQKRTPNPVVVDDVAITVSLKPYWESVATPSIVPVSTYVSPQSDSVPASASKTADLLANVLTPSVVPSYATSYIQPISNGVPAATGTRISVEPENASTLTSEDKVFFTALTAFSGLFQASLRGRKDTVDTVATE